jgi:N-formylglutamate amidohydrolase
VPEQVRGVLSVPREAILHDSDIHVEKLYADSVRPGATLLVARASRYVVDLNRAPDDVDSETVRDHPSPRNPQPRGVVWRATTEGRPAMVRPLTFRELTHRIEEYYEPYHRVLKAELGRLRDLFGFAILLAAHSMPSIGRVGHRDTGALRADVVPGTRGRTTAHEHVIDLVDAHFRGAGLSVCHDDPYRGGFTTGHYGLPAQGWHAIQIELNRALYVDEASYELRPVEFKRLKGILMELIAKLGKLDLRGK